MTNTLPLVYHPAAFSIEEEFLEELRKKNVREGEEGLMLAILEEAIACFRKYVHARDQRGKALFRDAAEWILERQSEWIFSFENICETLGIDASYLRQGLIQWKEKELGPREGTRSCSGKKGKGGRYADTEKTQGDLGWGEDRLRGL